MGTERAKALHEATALVTLQVSQKNLETAKLTHKKITEQLSMRTATVAQMAAVVLTSAAHAAYFASLGKKGGAAAAVKLAEEIMVEAEVSAAKANELADTLRS